MAAPTRAAYAETSTFAGTGTLTTGNISWSSGDVIVALGITADNSVTINTPTATGLTFAAVTATTGTNPTNTGSSTKGYAWVATAGSSGGPTTVSATVAGGATPRGLAVWVFSGSNGIGNAAFSASGTTPNGNLTRSGANSAVVWIGGDWNATNDTTVTSTPASGTQDHAQFVSGQYTAFAFDWGDQGSAGTTAYGLDAATFSTPTNFTKVAVEVLGASGGGGTTVKQLAAMGVG